MKKFYITFSARGLMDGWVELWAKDEEDARQFCYETYGSVWSGIYGEDDWVPGYFPHGSFGKVWV